jgi:GNAT superfamily N-acetyltransferase
MPAQAETIQPPAIGPSVREATPEDSDDCGRIFYDAFESIATRHNLPIEPPSRAFTHFMVEEMLANDGFVGLVADRGGEVVGSAFVDERTVIAGIGPVTIDPAAQDVGVGRALIECRARARARSWRRRRQARSDGLPLPLPRALHQARLRRPWATLGHPGTPPALSIPGLGVRAAREHDLAACNELCARVHGHDRSGELRDAIAAGTAHVVESPGGICGYASGFGYGWHAVAETNQHLIALIGSAHAFMGLGILIPTRNTELLRWCLAHDLKLVQQSTLMTIGLYNEPSGAWLPSIAYWRQRQGPGARRLPSDRHRWWPALPRGSGIWPTRESPALPCNKPCNKIGKSSLI